MAGSPISASAHGGPPAALGLLAANPDAEVMLLNEGLALKRPEGWSYLCPSLWGEIDLASGKFPLARSADGIDIYLPGGEDLFVLREGQLIAQNRPEYRRNMLIALANDSKNVYGLHITTIGERSMSEVVRLTGDGDPRFYASQEYWGWITANDQGIYIVSAGTQELTLVKLDSAGTEVERVVAQIPVTLNEMALHALGGRVYVTGVSNMGTLVGYLENGAWTEVLQDPMAVVGPQTSADGTMWIAIAGKLARLKDGVVEPVEDTRFVKCLETWNDRPYVCLDHDLHELTQDGIGERLFEMQGVLGTDPKMITAETKDSCEQQWLLYKIDAMRSELTFVDWPNGAAGAGAAGSSALATAGSAAPAAGAGASAAAGAGPDGLAGQASPPDSGGGCSVARADARAPLGLLSLLFAVTGVSFYARRARRR
ncbi:MAG TPA: hypothetical protein VMF89_37040 [Polyangiales bacterium]|nr:hypothetical protein [Polyangiales bacterium]